MENTFSKMAEDYDRTIALINSLDNWVFVKFMPKMKSSVLDIGCGTGSLLNLMLPYFRECYGIDNSEGMLSIARRNKNLKLFLGDANKLPFSDGKFDYIVSHTAFHHLDLARAIGEVRRVLKRGGRFVMVDVVRERGGLPKKIRKFIFRYIWSVGRMFFRFGVGDTLRAWKYSEGPVWSGHVSSEKDKFLTGDQFKKFYSELLPCARFGTANYSLGYLVWEKS